MIRLLNTTRIYSTLIDDESYGYRGNRFNGTIVLCDKNESSAEDSEQYYSEETYLDSDLKEARKLLK